MTEHQLVLQPSKSSSPPRERRRKKKLDYLKKVSSSCEKPILGQGQNANQGQRSNQGQSLKPVSRSHSGSISSQPQHRWKKKPAAYIFENVNAQYLLAQMYPCR